jgi:hypothetical protein
MISPGSENPNPDMLSARRQRRQDRETHIFHDGAYAAEDMWADWLVRIGYGTDFSTSAAPPCDVMDLARAYQRANPDDPTTEDEWADIILTSFAWGTD